MITFDHEHYLSQSDCDVIFHNFGVYSSMDGKSNTIINLKYPNIYYNLKIKRKRKQIRRGEFLITKIDKKYYFSLFASNYDYDSNTVTTHVNEENFCLALQSALEFLKEFDLDNLKIGAPAYFGAPSKKLQYQIMKCTNEVLGDKEITFYDKI